MFVNKKVLAAAIVGSLFAAGNAAAVNLVSVNPALTPLTATSPAYFAKELVVPAAGLPLTTGSVAPIVWQIGYSFSANEVRYVRLEAPAGFKFGAATPVLTGGPVDAVVGAVNGVGTNVLYFSVTAGATAGIPADATITVGVGAPGPVTINTISSTSSPISLTASLYDQPSQAQNGGDTGKINNATATGNYLAFAPSYQLTAVAKSAVANVEATPAAFTKFLVGGTSTTLADTIVYGVTDVPGSQAAPYTADGIGITLSDLFASAKLTIAGDFSPLANANGTYTGAALARAQLNSVSATELSASAAAFVVNDTAIANGAFTYTVNGTTAIPAGDFKATLTPTANASGKYAVTPIENVAFGTITRNGTELQAPLVQIPGGWIARLALTNTGSIDRPYTIKFLSEAGVTLGTANLTGTVPQNGTKVIDLTEVLTSSTAALRGTAIVNVAGPEGQIEGLYQIVNPATGALSNHVLIHNGSN